MSNETRMPNHALPKDYLTAMADKIHQMNPSRDITFNAFKDVFCSGYNRGYNRKGLESLFFRKRRNARYVSEWKEIRDYLDDKLHTKTT